jgi:predicted DNA binding CopG/RHH family protein
MSKRFPDLKTERQADAWMQGADLTEYDLSDMKKVRFELARKDASISLRLPAALRAAEEKTPTQRFIRILIEAQLSRELVKAKREPAGKTPRAATRSRNRAA